jgi:hypothetical protein
MKTRYPLAVYRWICFALLFISAVQPVFAGTTFHKKKTQNSQLELKGLIQDDMGSMGRVTVSICIDSTVFFTTQSTRSGRCRIVLPLNGRFTILFSSPGYVTKKICINTRVPAIRKGGYSFDFTLDLFEEINGLDISVLKDPIAIITFNNFTNAFDYDFNYTAAINESIKKLYGEYYSLKELEKKEVARK